MEKHKNMITLTSAGIVLGFLILINALAIVLGGLSDALKGKRDTASKLLGLLATVCKWFGLGLSSFVGNAYAAGQESERAEIALEIEKACPEHCGPRPCGCRLTVDTIRARAKT